MSNALKGVLFSAFIFPGGGQVILARYLRGLAFFGLAFVTATLLIAGIVRQAVLVLQELAAHGEVINTSRVMGIVVDISNYTSSLLVKISFLLLVCCWLVSVVDAYRIGRAMDEEICRKQG